MNNKDGAVTLGEREFKRVKNGVDEAEVGGYIDDLIRERDELTKSQHHVTSLTKLAENTIKEADRLAEQIKADATEKARAEADAVVEKAREQAQQMAEQKEAEILGSARGKADAIRAEAEKEAAALVESEQKRIWQELRGAVNQHFGRLLQELDALKQQAAAAQADFENRASQPPVQSRTVTAEAEQESTPAPVCGSEQEDTPLSGDSDEEPDAAMLQSEGEAAAVTGDRDKVQDQAPDLTQPIDLTEGSFDLSQLFQTDEPKESGEPQFEVEILPPVDMTRIMELVAHLDQLPEVANTEIIPRMDTPSILVFLREEMNFIDALSEIPFVAHIEEVASHADAENGDESKGPPRVRIALSGNILSHESPETK